MIKKCFSSVLVVLVLLLSSFSSSISKSKKFDLKGKWMIKEVSYEGSDEIKITSFGIGDSQCLVESTWFFNGNNSKGNLQLNKTSCPKYSSDIVWSLNKENTFAFKIIPPGVNEKKVTQGYNLQFVPKNENAFQLVDKANLGGRITRVSYKFQRVVE
ncbi:MAG: lipocalin family protein [Flavobacteriales bacterium]|nr:lipocalin family protein [Flavobacteriales bacterium]